MGNPISRYRVIIAPAHAADPCEGERLDVSQVLILGDIQDEVYQEEQPSYQASHLSASIEGAKLYLHLGFSKAHSGRQKVLEKLMNIHEEFGSKYDWIVEVDSEAQPPLGLFGLLHEIKREIEENNRSLKLVLRRIDNYSDAYLLKVLSNFETTLE